MKKLSLFLCIAILLAIIPLSVSASEYGAKSQKLVITHINETATYEGAGIVYTKSSDGTIGSYGSFDWWTAIVFDWSAADKCYTVTEVNSASGTPKSTIVIPEKGFVYCVNTGNNWPELYAKDPTTYAAYANSPDYTSEHTTESLNYANSLKIGDKAYLYGTDPVNEVILNNGALWYSDEFTSESFIKIGASEDSGTAYNPDSNTEIKARFNFGINAINSVVNEGQSMLLTPSYGNLVTSKGNNYNWSRIAIFDWSEKDGAYVLVSVDSSLGNGVSKDAVIPPNGFAISVNTGNNYPALGIAGKPNYVNSVATNVFDNIVSLDIGTKVYLEGIDLVNGTFEYEGDISKYYDTSLFTTKGFIKVCDEKPENAYQPSLEILETPVFVNTETIYTESDIEVKWNAVESADAYYVCVNDSTITPNGTAIFKKEVQETSITIPASNLKIGQKVTVRVYAKNANGNASALSTYSFTVCSERAVNSVFRDKTVVAFGDSITAWPGWVAMLEGQIGTNVINSGVGGDTTNHALARIEKDVISKNPDLVIVNFGMNDQAYDTSAKKNLTPIDKYEANYRKIIEMIKETGSDIILVAVHDVCTSKYGGGVPKYDSVDENGNTYVDVYNKVVKKLADEYKLGFLDINTLAQDKLETMISDGIHLSEAGQSMYCEWISDYCFEFIENKPTTDESKTESEEESAPTQEESDIDTSSEGMPTWQLVVGICAMFVGISVIGVMFIKVIKKNKK